MIRLNVYPGLQTHSQAGRWLARERDLLDCCEALFGRNEKARELVLRFAYVERVAEFAEALDIEQWVNDKALEIGEELSVLAQR